MCIYACTHVGMREDKVKGRQESTRNWKTELASGLAEYLKTEVERDIAGKGKS